MDKQRGRKSGAASSPGSKESPIKGMVLKVTVEPEVLMAGPPVTFTVDAVDGKTNAPVMGKVIS
jgi:hypothetical protein